MGAHAYNKSLYTSIYTREKVRLLRDLFREGHSDDGC